MPRTGSSPAATAALGLLALLVAGLPLARGGVDLPAQVAALLVAALALLLASFSRNPSFPALVGGFSAATAWMAFQIVPVPAGVHRLLSPAAAGLFDEMLRPLGLYPAARPLSLDPPAGGLELAKAAACLAAAWAAARLAAQPRRADWLLTVLAAMGVAVAAGGMLAAAAGCGPVLEPRLFFVNPNHLAGFLNLASFVALGMALRGRGQLRALWFLGYAVSATGVFLSLSRGGIAAHFAGAAVLTFVFVRRERVQVGNRSFLKYAIPPAAALAALGLGAWLALDPLLEQARTLSGAAQDVKLAHWGVALAILRRFPLAGIGRGAFETVFPAFKVEPNYLTFTHLENEWIETPLDLGIPVGLVLLAAVAWTWIRAALARDLSRSEMGALAGTAAVAAHNLFDFSLQVLGVALPFAVVLALLTRGSARVRTPAWVPRVAALALLGAGLGGAAFYRAHPTEEDGRRVARGRDADEAVALARRSAWWHPADHLPPATAGARLVQAGRCAEALPWLSRAMSRNPTASESHRYAARCLAAGHRDALASQEYRLAFLLGDYGALAEAAKRYPDLEGLLRIAPGTPDGLLALGALLAASRPEDAERVLARAWNEFGDRRALAGLASTVLALGRSEEGLGLARRLETEEPAGPQGYLLAANALVRLGRSDEARKELELGLSRAPGSRDLLVRLAEDAVVGRRYAEAHRLAESIAAQTPAEQASKRMFVARVLQAEGRLGEAIDEARGARDASPQESGPHETLSSLCAQAGRYDEAVAALEAAAGLPSARPGAYAVRLAELRAARQAQAERFTRQRILGPAEPSHPGR